MNMHMIRKNPQTNKESFLPRSRRLQTVQVYFLVHTQSTLIINSRRRLSGWPIQSELSNVIYRSATSRLDFPG